MKSIVTSTKEYVIYTHTNTWYFKYERIADEIKFLCFTIKIYDLTELEPLFEKVRRIELNKSKYKLQY